MTKLTDCRKYKQTFKKKRNYWWERKWKLGTSEISATADCLQQGKISDHRQWLLELLTGSKLHLKHYYLELSWFTILATSKTFYTLWPQDISWCWHIIWRSQVFLNQTLRLGRYQSCLWTFWMLLSDRLYGTSSKDRLCFSHLHFLSKWDKIF